MSAGKIYPRFVPQNPLTKNEQKKKATGILGIQYAKASNLTVYTTASPHNFSYLRSLGADHVYDYRTDPDTLAAQIRSDTDNKLTLAWDCLATPESQRLAALSLSDGSQPGVGEASYAALLPLDQELVRGLNPNIKNIGFTMGYTAFGEGLKRTVYTWVPSREDYEHGKMFWELSQGLLAEGKVKPARYELNRGGKGLEGVQKGLEELKEGKVSGAKLVYTFE